MAFTCKRPAASLDGHASQPGAMCRKRRRVVVGTTYDYDQESRLGAGKFGAVVKARCRATGQLVAIKSLHDPADPHEVLREARFLEACGGHPHIVGFRGVTLDYVTDELCLVMDYVEGKSLKLLLSERGGGLPEATVCTFMWQLLTAAKKMHRCHIVHRDINPANILVGGEVVKICDFGVAMSMSEAPPYEEEVGMGEYRAPEMLLGKEDYDALVDTWSLGCVMAEMLSGKRIFRADEFISLFQRIFQVVGVPDDTTWPGFTSLPHTAPPPLVPGQQSTLRDLFPVETLSAEGFEVLNGLLTCNPDNRLTAAAALKLPWFATVTAPTAAAKIDTMAVSIKEEVVEFAPLMPPRKRVTAKKTLIKKKVPLTAPPAA
ncbi:putative cyclin-dependent kinase F-2 [Aegilops tauschii subsp. strangulata]|uniref:putative cyclin-dependent kinase F-2 n=1 Tax=Aegilops tauschii subsp. strangulata TaxID=200361 RepID=UPI00098B768E|nr:putative cyclin-dependent kinase F-2 [Aegilops tauschii subsp. strangulata]